MRKIFLFVLMCLSLCRCKERIDINVKNSEHKLIVEASISNIAERQYIRLSKSINIFDKSASIQTVSRAKIYVNYDKDTIHYVETDKGTYVSTSKFKAIEGKQYHLNIENIDINKDGINEKYEATSGVPPLIVLDSIKMRYDSNFYGKKGWKVLIYTIDNKETTDFYAFGIIKNNKLLSDTITEQIIIKDAFFNGGKSQGLEIYFLNEKKSDEKLTPKDTIELITYSYTEDYYTFIDQLKRENMNQNAFFSSIPANIITNISNGGLGYFTCYQRSINTTNILNNL